MTLFEGNERHGWVNLYIVTDIADREKLNWKVLSRKLDGAQKKKCQNMLWDTYRFIILLNELTMRDGREGKERKHAENIICKKFFMRRKRTNISIIQSCALENLKFDFRSNSKLTKAESSLPGLRPEASMYVLPMVLIFSIPLNLGFNNNLSKSQMISLSSRRHSKPCLLTSVSS